MGDDLSTDPRTLPTPRPPPAPGRRLDDQAHALVVEAADEEEVRRRLGPDPWAPMGVLVIGSAQPWTIWTDSRPWAPAAADAAATPRATASASRD